MLRKMYLVLSDYLNTVTSKNTPPPPPQSPNTEKAGKNNSSKRLRSVKKIEKKKKNICRNANTIGGLQNVSRRDVDVTMISGLKYVANFTRRISKERTR